MQLKSSRSNLAAAGPLVAIVVIANIATLMVMAIPRGYANVIFAAIAAIPVVVASVCLMVWWIARRRPIALGVLIVAGVASIA